MAAKRQLLSVFIFSLEKDLFSLTCPKQIKTLLDFEQIYNQYKNLVFNLALQYVQNNEDAQEITQDTFLAVYDALPNFQHNSKISTWIYRITINQSLDFLKAKKRKKRFAFLTSLFFENSNEIKHDKQVFNHQGILLEHQEGLQKLFNQINELPDKQKTVVILLKIEQKTQADVAEIMNLSIKAVESLFQRAKNNLGKKINPNKGSSN